MKTMRIFSDSTLSAAADKLLRDGIAPHELIEPKIRLASVLATPESDPSFGLADIAFGQPDVKSILNSQNLKWVQVTSAGITRYDTPEFRAFAAERGLVVTNSSSVYAAACAEHALAFMLAQSRLLPEALACPAANGDADYQRLRAGSISLQGQHVVILGFGAIARELMRLLQPFAMKITAMRRSPRGDEGCAVVTPENLSSALATADHVVNILPENAESRGFVDAAQFAAMKPGAVFHNIGRGTTVNQDDLLAALRSRHLSAAWLDVTDPEPLPADHPLRHEAHCYITPHTAGGHLNEEEALVRHFLWNFQKFIVGDPLDDRVI